MLVKPSPRAIVLAGAIAGLSAAVLPSSADIINHAAQASIGQQNLVYNVLNQTGADSLYFPTDVVRDPTRSTTRLFVSDAWNSRVVGYECGTGACALPSGAVAVRVFGQVDFQRWEQNGGVGGRATAATMSFPSGVALTPDGRLVVADTWNNRVLIFLDPWADSVADHVLGQGGMLDTSAGSGLGQLRRPEGVAVDAAGTVWVADTGNNRVLGFPIVTTGAAAAVVLGGSGGPSPTTMSVPRGLAIGPSGHLYVADTGFNRVLRFAPGAASGAAAQASYGQGGSLTSGAANLGGVSAASLAQPEKVTVDPGGRLWVADTGNKRVLEFDAPLSSATAQRVYGQSSRTQVPTFATNVNDAPDGFPSASGFAGPRGVVIDGAGRLWVADRDNSRLLGFENPLHPIGDTAAAKAAIVADRIVGDTSFTDAGVNRPTAQRINNPFGLAVDRSATPNRLWVVDVGNNRVLGYNSTETITNNRAADLVLGQPDLASGDTNAGLNGPLQNAATAVASASSLFYPSGVAVDSRSGVYVADTSNNRILHFENPFGTDRTADRVFGQSTFSTLNPFFPYGTARGFAGPRGVAVDEADNLWVADTINHRVVRFSNAPGQPATGASADLVLGQSAFASSTVFPPPEYTPGCSATKLNRPYGVHAAASGRVYVADHDNHRVLVFAAPFSSGEPAVAVFGQPNFTSCAVNRGGVPGAGTLNTPWNAFEDDAGNVYIADYGNNRVLIYHTPFAGGDLVADEVMGQPSFSAVTVVGGPGPLSLFAPAGVDADAAGRVFVSDTENSRVLQYGTAFPSVLLDPLLGPVVVGDFLTVTGSGYTSGSVVMLFVSTSSGVVAHGPLTPSVWHPGFLIVHVPPGVPLGNGFASVQVINTDQGFATSPVHGHWLFGSAARGIPTIKMVNDVALPPPSPGLPTAYVETAVAQGGTITISGTGFSNALVNLFTAAGNAGPLSPLPGATATRLQVRAPDWAATGPGVLQIVNAPYTGNVISNAVSMVIGARLSITSVTQAGSVVTVNGTGFSVQTVINLYNRQGAGSVNLGGLTAAGAPRIPLTFINAQRVTFVVPAGAVSGPAFVEALNPPFVPYASSGADPDGAFSISAASPLITALTAASPVATADRDRARRVPSGRASLEAGRMPGPAFVVWEKHPEREGWLRARQAIAGSPGRLDWLVPAQGDLVVGLSDDAAPRGGGGPTFEVRVLGPARELSVDQGGEVVLLGTALPGDRLSVRVLDSHLELWHENRRLAVARDAAVFPLLVEAQAGAGTGPITATLDGARGTAVRWRVGRPETAGLGAVLPGFVRSWSSPLGPGAIDLTAELAGTAAIGLVAGAERTCVVCVARLGRVVQVWHDGTLRGSWAARDSVRVVLDADPARGTVRLSLDDVWHDEMPIVPLDWTEFAARAWLTTLPGRVSRAVVSADRHLRSGAAGNGP